jgi:hypothetical protein
LTLHEGQLPGKVELDANNTNCYRAKALALETHDVLSVRSTDVYPLEDVVTRSHFFRIVAAFEALSLKPERAATCSRFRRNKFELCHDENQNIVRDNSATTKHLVHIHAAQPLARGPSEFP